MTRLAALPALLALVLVLGSCGGDDDGGADPAAFCDEVESILASDNTAAGPEEQAQKFQEAIDKLEKVEPPEEIADDWDNVVKAWTAEDPAEVDRETTEKSGERLTKYVRDECGVTE